MKDRECMEKIFSKERENGKSGKFFFTSRRRHTRWNLVTGVPDVCSSDLVRKNLNSDKHYDSVILSPDFSVYNCIDKLVNSH